MAARGLHDRECQPRNYRLWPRDGGGEKWRRNLERRFIVPRRLVVENVWCEINDCAASSRLGGLRAGDRYVAKNWNHLLFHPV